MQKAIALFFAIAGVLSGTALADPGEYLSRDRFLSGGLGHEAPPSDVIWMDDELREEATRVLGHAPNMLRARYWYAQGRTAWILDEIGKERPITMGIVVENGRIQSFNVLEFRESRGWEIRYPFFARQFAGIGLDDSGELDEHIDGISGATLSVRAARRVATLALVLDERARQKNQRIASAE